MKRKPLTKPLIVIGILNELHWISGEARLLDGTRFFFNGLQAETLRKYWGLRVKCVLNGETRYLGQIEQAN